MESQKEITNTEAYLEYLRSFDPSKETAIIVVDTERRIKYEVTNTVMITDSEVPTIFIEIGGNNEPFENPEEQEDGENDFS